MTFQEAYEKHSDEEFLKFDRIQTKQSSRPDLCAFLMLDHLVPGTEDIISAAVHDEFYLRINPADLDAVASEAQMIDLIRCGIRYDSHFACLAMFT